MILDAIALLWIEEDVTRWWLSQEASGRPGASRAYSDKAIQACLSLRILLRLPLRQAEGFVRSLLCWGGLSLPVPDYTTLCRRQRRLNLTLPVRPREATRHIVLDSTGLKVFGEGEWKVTKHGKSASRRRVWKKIHVSVDETTGELLAVCMSEGEVDVSTALTYVVGHGDRDDLLPTLRQGRARGALRLQPGRHGTLPLQRL